RRALSELASDPPAHLLELVAERLGHPSVPTEALELSLARILDGRIAPSEKSAAPTAARPKVPSGPAGPPKGQEYPLDHHFGNKSSLIRELWEALDTFAESLGGEVTRRIRKYY